MLRLYWGRDILLRIGDEVEILPSDYGHHPTWFGKRVFVNGLAWFGSDSQMLRLQFIREDGSECYLALPESVLKFIRTEEQHASHVLGDEYFA